MKPELRRGRPEASAAIWAWREAGHAEADTAAALRRRGLLQAAVGLAIAAGLYFGLGWRIIPAIAAAVAVFTAMAALTSPTGLYARISRALEAFGMAVGTLVTWIVLAPLFYLVFTPFGLVAKRGANDPMKRRYDRAAGTYWITRTPDADREAARLRQY
jgi:hypothetical protein